MGPLLFEPYFRPQIWGGRRLANVLGKLLPPNGRYGESWEVSAHPLHVSRLRGQSSFESTLASLWEKSKMSLWGESYPSPVEFPWLVKFLDCDDFLSVQVHPDSQLAAELVPTERGKDEVWVIVSADAGAKVYLGLRPDATPSRLRQAIQRGHPEDCLNVYSPQPGDIFHIPPGTVHSAGGGVLIAEIQTSSDATFRLYDWNRLDERGQPRPLHIEQAFRAIHWQREVRAPLRTEFQPRGPGWLSQLAASTANFHIECWQIAARTQIEPPHLGMTVAMVLSGSVILRVNSSPPLTLPKGETVLIPACVNSVLWSNPLDLPAWLVVCSPPVQPR